MMLADGLPLMLGWSALNRGEVFERVEMTALRLDAAFDAAAAFDPESVLRDAAIPA